MFLFCHPTGNANARNAALAFAECGALAEFWTCVSWDVRSPWNRLLPASLRAQLGRRALPDELRPFARHHPWREMGRMLFSRTRWGFPCRHERGAFCIDAVFQSLDRRVARRVAGARGISGVYAYEDGAADTFDAASERGVACIYDLPIGYWRVAHQILAEEAEREPEWACTLTGLRDSAEKLARKDRELALADTVVVASSFTRRTIDAAPAAPAKIHVIPYGAPLSQAAQVERGGGGPLRVLFAGSLGQRKGLSYLLRAAEMMGKQIELTLLGARVSEECRPLNEAVGRHRWIRSLPHAEVLCEMVRNDVLVFPSLFEGFGLVILEAMAQGLPVITTAHTAGPDLITDGVDGFIVPIRSAEAIAGKLSLLAGDRGILASMREAAQYTAKKWTWDTYRKRLTEALLPGDGGR